MSTIPAPIPGIDTVTPRQKAGAAAGLAATIAIVFVTTITNTVTSLVRRHPTT